MVSFRDTVRERINGLTREQTVEFARICALQALPFLSSAQYPRFTYWEKEKIQKYLLAVFTVFDAAYHAAFDVAAAYAYRHFYGEKTSGKFEAILLQDIEHIRNGKYSLINNDISIYGDLWSRFSDDLNAVGCGYRARWYEKLFKNRFVEDEREVERRRSVPDEIRAQGEAEFDRYLERLGDVEKLNEARITILGEKGAGKTCLARKLADINAGLTNDDESTEGVDVKIWTFPDNDGNPMNAHIWDFAGHSITHAAHRCFMTARCLYIYVYNGRIERDNDPEYWLEQIRIHGGDSPVLFLINRKDKHPAAIAYKTLQDKYPAIKGYYIADKTETEDFQAQVKRAERG